MGPNPLRRCRPFHVASTRHWLQAAGATYGEYFQSAPPPLCCGPPFVWVEVLMCGNSPDFCFCPPPPKKIKWSEKAKVEVTRKAGLGGASPPRTVSWGGRPGLALRPGEGVRCRSLPSSCLRARGTGKGPSQSKCGCWGQTLHGRRQRRQEPYLHLQKERKISSVQMAEKSTGAFDKKCSNFSCNRWGSNLTCAP